MNVCKWLIVCDNDLPQQFSYWLKWVKETESLSFYLSTPMPKPSMGNTPNTVTVSSSAIVFKLGGQTGNIYPLTTGLVNSDKAIHKMTPNCWHLSISRILNGFPWLEDTKGFKGAFFALSWSSLPTAKKVPFSRFWEHPLPTAKTVPSYAFHEIAWNRKKRYFFCPLKHRLVKWEMDEERIILTSKYHSLENWK